MKIIFNLKGLYEEIRNLNLMNKGNILKYKYFL